MLEEFITKEQCSVVPFFYGQDSMKNILIKNVFPFYGGKYLLLKAAHNWMVNVSLMTNKFKWRCGCG
jgi:hypothetical protein